MKIPVFGVSLLCFAMLCFGAGPASAMMWQDESDAASGVQEPPGEPDTAVAGEVPPLEELESTEVLQTRILPLRRAALQAEAEQWITRVEAITRALADVRLAARSAAGEERSRLLERAAALSQYKAALIDRAEIVVDALDTKGGEVEELEQYLEAVGGADVDVTDMHAVWIYFRNWLTSPEGGIEVGLNLLKFLITLFAFWIAARIVGAIVRRAVNRLSQTSELLRDFLVNMTRKTIVIVGFVVALSMLGVNIGPLVAAIGAAGLVIGLALQGTLSNFASGILILIYRPFDVGDAIEVAGETGKVDSMTLVTTTIVSFDNQKIIVPNNEIWNNVITNITGRPTRRVDMVFGISYEDDIDRAREVLLDIVTSHELVLKDPEPLIRLNALADSSVNFIVRPWAKTSDYWAVYWDVHAEVKRRFDAEDITIPYPQRDVHVYEEKARRHEGT